MKFSRIALFAAALTACASHTAFHKAEDGRGYTVKDTPIPEILMISLSLPPDTKDDYRTDYLARAAGEECAARKFPFFDFAATKRGDGRAFCYLKEAKAQLGATLDPKAAAGRNPILRVVDTQMGKFSPFRPWDVIRKVGGRAVHDMAEFKESIFLAGRQKTKRISVLVERSEIPLLLDSPIVESGDELLTPDMLEALRVRVP